ncbi:NADH-quinone oxidoreductase subunit NuoE family protein [Leptospira sp. GIMC2001]|uniref:NADH-quinone oxidoreductase subunit NuoE family protein n=1 Tax=Leptospira sp. GIMC2001 TaxID=1513297 RepID=UPI00234B5CB1|nr:NAD(P)H-dependent oxidoreductase subunit E [Leptospira sp. GIMC2001]WCL48195.1 NAD(P)H-dependent oxidoreductase subunit E [Leptospira sp. GIMC2001]
MAYQFSSHNEATFNKIKGQFPDKRSLILPCLYFVQRDIGYVDKEGMEYIAERIGDPISLAQVYGVATFYTMYNKKPVGKFHIQICSNISCYLAGSDSITKGFCDKLGIQKGDTSTDKMYTVDEVQCLGACGFGPVVQINDRYHENLRAEDIDGLIAALRAEVH